MKSVATLLFRATCMGIIGLTMYACDSHTPLVNASAREAHLARLGSAKSHEEPQPLQPVPPVSLPDLGSGDNGTNQHQSDHHGNDSERAPVEPPPSEEGPAIQSSFAHPVAQIETSTLNASTRPNFPYLNTGERIPVIFPRQLKMGASYLERPKETPGEVRFNGGPFHQKKFKIEDAGRENEATWISMEDSQPPLKIGNQWNQNIPHLLFVRGSVGGEPFFLLRRNPTNNEHDQKSEKSIGSWENLQPQWGAYLLDPRFETFAEKYDFANLTIEKQNDKVWFSMRRFGETPWVKVDVTHAELHPFHARFGSKHLELCCALLGQVPILVGKVAEPRDGKNVEIWFVAFPMTAEIPTLAAAN